MVAPVRLALPIDEHLAAIAQAVRSEGGAIVVAEPGAGKTTRVPGMLLDELGLNVTCTQPRRIAARLSAARVAEERSSQLGHEVGYEVRFDRKRSASTKLCFMTEGLALRQWSSEKRGARVLVLDEFHERHLDADMLLALAARERAQGGKLSLVVMSATLDAEPLSRHLQLPVIRSEGRHFPVHASYLATRANERLETQVSRALREVLADREDQGHVLVFLPGLSEIRRCQEQVAELAKHNELLVLPLHGSLSRDEQDRALRPSRERRVILATNVAETSLTIEGVTTVVDAGTARVARHSPWTGLSSLQVEPISQASAKQRAGRAGRTAPGRCIRLYSEHDLVGRRGFDSPEIVRADLTGSALQLAAEDLHLDALPWLDAPPPLAVENAYELLTRLGALQERSITPLGRRMSLLPVHARLARIVIEAERLGVPSLGASAAGLLSEPALRRQSYAQEASASSSSDVLDDLDLLDELRASGFRPGLARTMNVDIGVARNADKIAAQILRSLDNRSQSTSLSESDRDEAVRRALLTGFPDRAGKRVRARGDAVLLCSGGAVTLSRTSAVLDAEYLIAMDVEERGVKGARSALVRVASAIDPSWLLDMPGLREVDEHEYLAAEQRVIRRTGIYYGDIPIDEERIVDPRRMDGPAAARALRQALIDGRLQDVGDSGEFEAYRLRYQFVADRFQTLEWPALDSAYVVDALLATVDTPTRLGDFKSSSLVEAVHWSLSQEQRQALDRFAPTHISLPGRARVPVHYESDRDPWIESRLQDFFGLKTSPSVAEGRVPLVMHLLAPNYRAVQVTTDLLGFWERHYPALRTQLMRRYPRHKWPEKP